MWVHTCTLMETFQYYYCLHHDCVFRLRPVYCIMSTVVCSIQGGDANHLCTTKHTYTHKHTCYTFNYLTSVLTDIDLCKRYPWGRWSYTYLPPPALPLSPLSVIPVSYSMSFGKKRKNPSRFAPDYLSVPGLSAYDWCIAHKYVCERTTHNGFPCLPLSFSPPSHTWAK